MVDAGGRVSAPGPRPAIACLGLAFKPDIDDLRESPSVLIAEGVARALPDREIIVVEPHVLRLPAALDQIPNVELLSLEDGLLRSSTVALLVDHAQFKELRLRDMDGKHVIDTRGIWRTSAKSR